jgi:hypothetical protein
MSRRIQKGPEDSKRGRQFPVSRGPTGELLANPSKKHWFSVFYGVDYNGLPMSSSSWLKLLSGHLSLFVLWMVNGVCERCAKVSILNALSFMIRQGVVYIHFY